MKEIFDVVVIGLGPAGSAAAIYSARYGLKTVVIGDGFGKAAEAYLIENIPGIKKVSGNEFANTVFEQLKALNCHVEFATVEKIVRKNSLFEIETNGKKFITHTLILAIGTEQRKLGLPNEEKFVGRGVAYCATCDAPFTKGKNVAVVGGGNSAVSSAVLLSKFAKNVYLIYYRNKLKADEYWIKNLKAEKNIEVIYNATLEEIVGKTHLEAIKIKKNSKFLKLAVDWLFILIGTLPRTKIAADMGVALDESGYIIVDDLQRTNIPGVFAAGDCTTGHNKWQQIVVAAAEGALAANSAYRYLTEKE